MGRALLVMDSDFNRRKAIEWIGKAPVGTRVEFKASKRTLPQNDLLWALLTEVSQQLKLGGKSYDPTQWKAIFLHGFGREIDFLPSLDGTTFLPVGMSSSDLSKEEMTEFIEFILKEGTERGVVFRDHHQPDNQNSDEQSPPSSEPAGDTDSAPAAAGENSDPPPPGSSPAASILDCAKDMLMLARGSYKNDAERDNILSLALADWEAKLPDEQPKLDDIGVAARAVATKARTLEQARAYLSKRLNTTVEELGGNG